jgi:hypothetical protein
MSSAAVDVEFVGMADLENVGITVGISLPSVEERVSQVFPIRPV